MAGDWIKMRVDIGDDPAVIAIAESTEKTEDEIVGKLHRLWSWADRHATDGFAIGITRRWVDKYVGISGFSTAMESAKWIDFEESGVRFPNFDRHNGKSAKTRCDAAIRQRLSRKERDEGVTGRDRTLIPRPFYSAVLRRDEYRCAYCGSASSSEKEASRRSILSVDHIVPATRGGRSSMDNLLTACKLCNSEKNDRTPEEWGLIPEFLAEGVTYLSQKICDSAVTPALPEKRREEKRTNTDKHSLAVAIYQRYPRKVGKKAALIAINKALKEKDPTDLLASVNKFARACENTEERFIPHPATWFNRGSYDDEESPAQTQRTKDW